MGFYADPSLGLLKPLGDSVDEILGFDFQSKLRETKKQTWFPSSRMREGGHLFALLHPWSFGHGSFVAGDDAGNTLQEAFEKRSDLFVSG